MDINLKDKEIFWEFLRYGIVGGLSFLIDAGTMYLTNEFILGGNHVYIAVLLGYLAGNLFNFIFSCLYVFKDGFSKIKNKEFQYFIIFSVIGGIGLGLTELFMYIFVDWLHIYYVVAKIITGTLVVIWNFIARKVVIPND